MTVGEFKKWCEDNGVPDDAIVAVQSYDSEGFASVAAASKYIQVSSLGGGLDSVWIGKRPDLSQAILVVSG